MENLDLSAFFTTKSEANDFSTRISQLSERVYNTGFDLERELIEKLGMNKKEKIITLLRDNNVSTSSNSDLKAFFEKIIQTISTLPVMSITIAFEPQDTTMKKLSDWFILNFKQQSLFEIRIDEKIVGGAMINYKGKFADFSIKPQFEQIMQRFTVRINPPLKEKTNGAVNKPAQNVIANSL